LDEVDEIDRGITRWIGRQPPSPLDVAMKGLSAAANHGMLQLLPNPPTSSSFPSGHAASAAAFATAVALECPKAGLAIARLAAAVAYSRIHVGVHWTSDVLAGAAVGFRHRAGHPALVAGAEN
jgi:membrane-associated phospholipid phosphatase